MERFCSWIIQKRNVFFTIFILLIAACAFTLPLTNIEYDLAQFLPGGTPSKLGVTLMESEFGLPATAEVMAEDVSVARALELKDDIARIEGVASVMWLDDVADVRQPVAALEKDYVDSYYKDGNALFTVNFVQDGDSALTMAALGEIEALMGENGRLRGDAVESRAIKDVVSSQMTTITAIIIPSVILVLFLVSSSLIEPLVLLISIATSILLNMGTNFIFPSVSYITNSMCIALQLAVSMDYSIFLMHRFRQELETAPSPEQAMARAVRGTFTSVSSSALTTLAGFLALCIMRFSLGMDMGLVFAKGIVIGFFTVVFFMPAVTLRLYPAMKKTTRRPITPPFEKMSRGLLRARPLTMAVCLLLIIPAALGQANNTFIYGASSVVSTEGEKVYEDSRTIGALYGDGDTVALMTPTGNRPAERAMLQEIQALPSVKNVLALANAAPLGVPDQMLPAALTENFQSQDYSRMVIQLHAAQESDEAYAALDDITSIAGRYYPDFSYTGGTAVAKDIRDAVEVDYTIVNLISILAVGIIILLAFKSLLIPVILVLTIEGAILLNTCVPYFMGESPMFVGFMIISAIQLGATIDYAILLATRYFENRRLMPATEAAGLTIQQSAGSILTSAVIMAIAGLLIGFMCTIDTIAQIGVLIGRGALLSLGYVFFLLPGLLILLDKPIRATTYHADFYDKKVK